MQLLLFNLIRVLISLKSRLSRFKGSIRLLLIFSTCAIGFTWQPALGSTIQTNESERIVVSNAEFLSAGRQKWLVRATADLRGPHTLHTGQTGHGTGWWWGAGVAAWLVKVTAEWQVAANQVTHQSSVGPDIHSLISLSLTHRRHDMIERPSERQPGVFSGSQTGLRDSEIITVSTDSSLDFSESEIKGRERDWRAIQQVVCFITYCEKSNTLFRFGLVERTAVLWRKRAAWLGYGRFPSSFSISIWEFQ